ncbi:MAG: glycosyltransferase family 4 protein [Planctomycetota bacterium]
MKILFALDKYGVNSGGADRYARAVVRTLLAAGHEVFVLQGGNPAPEERDGVRVLSRPLPRPRFFRDGDRTMLRWNRLWSPYVERELAALRPDLLLSQNMLAPSSVAAGRAAGVRTAIFFHGYRCLSPAFFREQDALTTPLPSFRTAPLRARLKWPLVARSLALYQSAYRKADLVVANSAYTARVIERFFERRAEVLYPVFDLAAPETAPKTNPGGPVLFVKPQSIKGVDVLLKTAPLLPQKRFLAVGRASVLTRLQLARVANIEYREWTEDMDASYASASLLFGPSQIPEPFGRVFVEAAIHGLPSVASAGGGIPEAVGEGGVLLPFDSMPGEWAEALEQALDPLRYEALSQAAFRHSHELLKIHTPARLLGILGAA